MYKATIADVEQGFRGWMTVLPRKQVPIVKVQHSGCLSRKTFKATEVRDLGVT